MAIWLVRAGSNGERENFALDNDVVVIGFDDVPDMSTVETREALKEIMRTAEPDIKDGAVNNYAGQVWAFGKRIKEGDIVVLPLKLQSAIALGKVTGQYKYLPDNPESAKHVLPVQWLSKDMPRDRFSQDLLYSFGAFMTVCQISRNNAEERIQGVLSGKTVPIRVDEIDATDAMATIDLEAYGATQIESYIRQEFKGHDFARLIATILNAQGYQTSVSPPGVD